jgi:hypothetical protein
MTVPIWSRDLCRASSTLPALSRAGDGTARVRLWQDYDYLTSCFSGLEVNIDHASLLSVPWRLSSVSRNAPHKNPCFVEHRSQSCVCRPSSFVEPIFKSSQTRMLTVRDQGGFEWPHNLDRVSSKPRAFNQVEDTVSSVISVHKS